jgi:hypothetical protein
MLNQKSDEIFAPSIRFIEENFIDQIPIIENNQLFTPAIANQFPALLRGAICSTHY